MASVSALLSSLALGCGGNGETPTDGQGGSSGSSAGVGAATSGSGALSGSGGSMAGAGGSAGGMAGAGGSAGSNVAGGGSGGSNDADALFPFADGRTWTYLIEAIEGPESPACTDDVASITGTAPTPGGTGWVYEPACNEDQYVMVPEGDDIRAYRDGAGPPIEYTKAPVSDGAAWGQYVWRELGEVDVPAGHFSDCWRREIQGLPTEFVDYCRGVGHVRSESADLDLRLSLQSTNF